MDPANMFNVQRKLEAMYDRDKTSQNIIGINIGSLFAI